MQDQSQGQSPVQSQTPAQSANVTHEQQTLTEIGKDNYSISIPDKVIENKNYTEAKPEVPFEMPEKFKGKSLEDMAKSYTELEKKLGANAPSQYEIEITEEMSKQGFDVEVNDPIFQEVEKLARESKMSNENFNKLVNLHLNYMKNQLEVSDEVANEHYQKELQSLGPDGALRVEQIKTWAKNNLDDHEFKVMQQFCTTADEFKVLQKIINQSATAHIPNNVQGERMSMTQLRELRDPYKTPYGRDMEYTKRMDDLFIKSVSQPGF